MTTQEMVVSRYCSTFILKKDSSATRLFYRSSVADVASNGMENFVFPMSLRYTLFAMRLLLST
jgi:hypothetical protein